MIPGAEIARSRPRAVSATENHQKLKLQSKLKVARLSGVETSHNLIEPAIKSVEASNRPSGLKATLDAYQETPICNINSGPAARGPDASAVFALGSLR